LLFGGFFQCLGHCFCEPLSQIRDNSQNGNSFVGLRNSRKTGCILNLFSLVIVVSIFCKAAFLSSMTSVAILKIGSLGTNPKEAPWLSNFEWSILNCLYLLLTTTVSFPKTSMHWTMFVWTSISYSTLGSLSWITLWSTIITVMCSESFCGNTWEFSDFCWFWIDCNWGRGWGCGTCCTGGTGDGIDGYKDDKGYSEGIGNEEVCWYGDVSGYDTDEDVDDGPFTEFSGIPDDGGYADGCGYGDGTCKICCGYGESSGKTDGVEDCCGNCDACGYNEGGGYDERTGNVCCG